VSEGVTLSARLAVLWKGRVGMVLRGLFALLPIVWLTRRVRWADVLARAKEVGLGNLVLAFAALVFSALIASVRWRTMMLAYGAEATPPLTSLLRHYLVGFYFNMLPSGVAGDGVRAHRVVPGAMRDMASSLTVVFLERVAGLFGLCIVAASAMVLGDELHDDAVATLLEAGLLGALALSAAVLVAPWALKRFYGLRGLVGRIPLLGGLLLGVPSPRSYMGLLRSVGQSVGTQGMAVVSVALVVKPLAPGISFLVCARVVPAVILATYIPLTPGGLGQRELVFQYMFGLVGVRPDAAVATSLLFFAMLVGLAALGGLCLLVERALSLDEPGVQPVASNDMGGGAVCREAHRDGSQGAVDAEASDER